MRAYSISKMRYFNGADEASDDDDEPSEKAL